MDRQQAINAGMYRRIYVIIVVHEKKKFQNVKPGKPGTAIKTPDLRFFHAFLRVREILWAADVYYWYFDPIL